MGRVPDDLNAIVAVEAEVDALRDRTQKIVAELERRLRARATQVKETFDSVKRFTDVPKQIAAHPTVVISIGAGLMLVLALGTYSAIARRRAARRPMARLRGRMHEYGALLAHPERWRQPPPKPSLLKRLLTAILIAGATQLVRGLGTLLIEQSSRSREPATRARRLALPPRP
ncbi:MAG TPA: hypothetical protein VIA18_23180 [Polyangia bacterium]|jgi:ElaB/YqjD/DUF883 family membrane-anchored ribosome-binding protein|nr:hypothetical protein [Polyangia bacterium]